MKSVSKMVSMCVVMLATWACKGAESSSDAAGAKAQVRTNVSRSVENDVPYVQAHITGAEAELLYAKIRKTPTESQSGYVKYLASSDTGLRISCVKSTTPIQQNECYLSINESLLNQSGQATLVQKGEKDDFLVASVFSKPSEARKLYLQLAPGGGENRSTVDRTLLFTNAKLSFHRHKEPSGLEIFQVSLTINTKSLAN